MFPMSKKSAGLFCALALSFATTAFAQTDATLTASVKTKLAADDVVKAGAVNVDTQDHVVTLSGAVASKAARDRAVAIAKGTSGVTSVVDKLTVSETAATSGKSNADKAAGGVEKGVDKSADAVGTAAHKTAGAVDKSKDKAGEAAEKTGDALGTAAHKTGEAVGTAAHKTGEAVGTAAKKTGEAVSGGADKTAHATEKAGEKTKDATEKAGKKTDEALSGDQKATEPVTDAAVTASVKTKLLGDGKTPGLKIDVDTQDGVVTLSGDVPTAAAHAEALRLARATKGVKRVVDKMTVAGK
jgi:hyperosmotically inducible protein